MEILEDDKLSLFSWLMRYFPAFQLHLLLLNSRETISIL